MTNYKVYHSDLTVSGSSFLFICGRVINTSLSICESVDPFIVGDVINIERVLQVIECGIKNEL